MSGLWVSPSSNVSGLAIQTAAAHDCAALTAELHTGTELSALMSLLLQLGCLEQGQPLSLGSFSSADRAICLDLAHLGLLLPFWCAFCEIALQYCALCSMLCW